MTQGPNVLDIEAGIGFKPTGEIRTREGGRTDVEKVEVACQSDSIHDEHSVSTPCQGCSASPTLQDLIERAPDWIFFHFDMGLKGVLQLPQMGNDNNFRKVVLNRFDDFDE